MTLLSFIIPTRDRPEELQRTLAALGALETPRDSAFAWCECEAIIIDNAGATPVQVPDVLANGLPVQVMRLRANLGAAARNEAATRAAGKWLVMLDDDSAPDDGALLALLPHVPEQVVGLCADIRIPQRGREAGGLPEVPIGCGVALRRDAFLAVGGYDSSYQFYAEEYDLAAKLIRLHADEPGPIFAHEPQFRVTHRKVATNRSMNTILHRLVRNNAWTIQRYTPDAYLDAALRHMLDRYRAIARKEDAMAGYGAGRQDVEESLAHQPRAPLPQPLYDRFTGLAATRAHIKREHAIRPFTSAHIIHPGKNEWAVRQALGELGVDLVDANETADVHVIGTLSPGPLLDAFDQASASSRVLKPWEPHPARRAHADRATLHT
ncbi:MAG: glycosyltransferase [Phycisphaerales bacterium]|nr:glycosyltransferase [Phycisphaerales bacterium]